jgi:hypothetical protein
LKNLAMCFSLSAFQRFSVSAFPLYTFPFQLCPLQRIMARLFVMGGTIAQSSVGCQVSLSGHRPSVTQFN